MQNHRALLLKQLLPLVVFDGWTEFALREAGKRTSLDAATVKRAFPRGVTDAIDYFYATADEALAQALPPETLHVMRFPDRIEALMLAKLDYYCPHREALRRANAHMSLPWNIHRALATLYRSVDQIWKLAGDRSADFSFYTKRATLAALYSSTLLFWLNDTSENEEDSHAFLHRRLQDIADFGKWKKELQAKLGRMAG